MRKLLLLAVMPITAAAIVLVVLATVHPFPVPHHAASSQPGPAPISALVMATQQVHEKKIYHRAVAASGTTPKHHHTPGVYTTYYHGKPERPYPCGVGQWEAQPGDPGICVYSEYSGGKLVEIYDSPPGAHLTAWIPGSPACIASWSDGSQTYIPC